MSYEIVVSDPDMSEAVGQVIETARFLPFSHDPVITAHQPHGSDEVSVGGNAELTALDKAQLTQRLGELRQYAGMTSLVHRLQTINPYDLTPHAVLADECAEPFNMAAVSFQRFEAEDSEDMWRTDLTVFTSPRGQTIGQEVFVDRYDEQLVHSFRLFDARLAEGRQRQLVAYECTPVMDETIEAVFDYFGDDETTAMDVAHNLEIYFNDLMTNGFMAAALPENLRGYLKTDHRSMIEYFIAEQMQRAIDTEIRLSNEDDMPGIVAVDAAALRSLNAELNAAYRQ